jgi:hypothetical protein
MMDAKQMQDWGYTELSAAAVTRLGDYFEWRSDAFTTLDDGSSLIGVTVGNLPPIDHYGSKHPTRVFRKTLP